MLASAVLSYSYYGPSPYAPYPGYGRARVPTPHWGYTPWRGYRQDVAARLGKVPYYGIPRYDWPYDGYGQGCYRGGYGCYGCRYGRPYGGYGGYGGGYGSYGGYGGYGYGYDYESRPKRSYAQDTADEA